MFVCTMQTSRDSLVNVDVSLIALADVTESFILFLVAAHWSDRSVCFRLMVAMVPMTTTMANLDPLISSNAKVVNTCCEQFSSFFFSLLLLFSFDAQKKDSK